MKTPLIFTVIAEAVREAAKQGIERRLGGYKQAVHRDDPGLPTRAEGDPPRVAVVGGGIAGITAAYTLAERGFAVSLFERNAWLGGKAGAWEVAVDGERQRVDHGFHAFFRHYHNLLGLMEALGCAGHLRPIDDYVILRTDRSRISFRGTDTTPLLNLLSLSKTGLYRPADLLFNARMRKLDPFLRYDEERTFAEWDKVSFDDFSRDADLPRDLQLVFNTFARAFFAEGDRLSVAALVRAFHFYYLSNDAGLLYDHLDDDHETAFATPAKVALEARGVRVTTGAKVDAVVPDGEAWRVAGERFESVVLACDVVGARDIVASSSALRERHPDFAARVARQKSSQRYAILRLWLDREVGGDLPVFVITDRLRALDAVSFVHRVVPAARAWAARRKGGVYELHCYAVPDAVPDDVAIERQLRAEFEHYLPEARGARVLGSHLHVRSDFAAFHVGTHADRATVETGVAGLWVAGDWVRLPFPAALMEAACMSGLLAANGVLRARGLREAPVYAVSPKGILAK